MSASSAGASLIGALTGFVDLAAVQSQREDRREETVRQEYNIALSHFLTPWVDFRIAARYYRFDQELELLLGGYRQEFQPSGELRWSHPWFTWSTSAFHREVVTSARSKLITNDFQSSLRTQDQEGLPSFELRYDQQHTFSPDVPEDRDIRNSRIQFNAFHDTRQHFFSYSYSHIKSENVITTLSAVGDRHLFRWEGNGRMLGDPKSQLTGRYTFNYGTVKNEVPVGGRILEIAPISVGLYAQDDAPDLGTLTPRPSLADGNKSDPAQPLIDIGGGNNNHNLGADLGISQAAAGIYIYTDRPSGSDITWFVYGSHDNRTWQVFPGTPGQFFNVGFNRYELSFPAADYRYIKAVNAGINEIALAYVTEIEVLRELPADTREESFSAASHLIDGRIGYELSRRWQTSLDVALQADENIGRRGDRWRASAGWRVNFRQSRTFRHHLRWILSRQDGQLEASVMENVLGYTMTMRPIRTVRGSFSLSDQRNYLEGRQSQNLISSILEGTATLYPGLNVSLGGGANWFNDLILFREYTTWQLRGGVDASLTRTLDFIFDYNYNVAREEGREGSRSRELATFGLDWRITPDLYFRGSLRYTAQRTTNWTQEYTATYTILPGMRINGQFFQIESDGVRTTFRRSASFFWDLGRRNSLYLRVAEVDVAGAGGATTESFQQGIRIVF